MLGSGDLLVTFVNSGDVLVAFGCYVWLRVLLCPPSLGSLFQEPPSLGIGRFPGHLWGSCLVVLLVLSAFLQIHVFKNAFGDQCLVALGVLSATLCIKNSLRLGPDDFLAT